MPKKINYQVKKRLSDGKQYLNNDMTAGRVGRSELLRILNIPYSRLDKYLKEGLIPYTTSKVKQRNAPYLYNVSDVRERFKQIDELQAQGLTLKQINKQLNKMNSYKITK